MAQLALPPCLRRLETIFAAVNSVHCFLLMRNIEVGRKAPFGQQTGANAVALRNGPLTDPRGPGSSGVVPGVLQATWATMKSAVCSFPGAQDAALSDVRDMVALCPEVVFLHDTSQCDCANSLGRPRPWPFPLFSS